MPIDSIELLPDGPRKLIETVNLTRLPSNLDKQTEELLDHCINVARESDLHDLLAKLLTNKAQIAVAKKQNEFAITLLDEAFEIVGALPALDQLEGLNALAIAYRRVNLPTKALDMHERHNAITKGKNDLRTVMHRITNLQNQANVLLAMGQLADLKACNEEVIALMKQIKDPQLLFNIKFNLAFTLISMDEVEEAAVLLNELMPEIERNAGGREARFYQMVADNAIRMEDMPRSAAFYTKAHHSPTANPLQKLYSATQLVRCYMVMNRADSVEKYIRICRKIRENPIANYGEVDQTLVDAQYAVFKKDYAKAKQYYKKNIQTSMVGERPLHPVIFQSYTELAQVYDRESHSDSAKSYISKIEQHVHDLNIPRYLKLKYYAVAGQINTRAIPLAVDKDSVISALSHQLMLKDGLYDSTMMLAYADMESKYRLHEKERQLQLAQQREEIQQLNIKKQQQRVWVLVLVGSVIIISLTAIYFVSLQRRKQAKERHQAQLQHLAQQHRIDTAKVLRTAEEEERKKIAGKLHDEVGALLSIAKLNINQLEADVFVAGSEAETKLATTQKLLSEVSDAVRSISHTLMPVALEKYGLKAAILDLISAVNASGKIKVEEVIEGLDDTTAWSEDFCISLYRIVQEVLNNIIKHSRASHVLVQIINLDNSVTIYMEDNGEGFNDVVKKEGLGLRLLKSNIEYLNGVIEINGRENKGTFVLIELPLESAAIS